MHGNDKRDIDARSFSRLLFELEGLSARRREYQALLRFESFEKFNNTGKIILDVVQWFFFIFHFSLILDREGALGYF